jgi:hypothetical protein
LRVNCRHQVREHSGNTLSISCCVPKREGSTFCGCSGSMAVAEMPFLHGAQRAQVRILNALYHASWRSREGRANLSPAAGPAKTRPLALTATHSLIYISHPRSLLLFLESCGLQQLLKVTFITAPEIEIFS